MQSTEVKGRGVPNSQDVSKIQIPGLDGINRVMLALGNASITELMPRYAVVEPYEQLIVMALATTLAESHLKFEPLARQLFNAAHQWYTRTHLPPAEAVFISAKCLHEWSREQNFHQRYSENWLKSFHASRAASAWVDLQRAKKLEATYRASQNASLDKASFIRQLDKLQQSAKDLSNLLYVYKAPSLWQNMANDAHRDITNLIKSHQSSQRPKLRLVS